MMVVKVFEGQNTWTHATLYPPFDYHLSCWFDIGGMPVHLSIVAIDLSPYLSANKFHCAPEYDEKKENRHKLPQLRNMENIMYTG